MKKINCPQCGKETLYNSDNNARPFCSERCQLIDLGEWADEKYGIASEDHNSEEIDQESSNE